jgi:hypothetical protein
VPKHPSSALALSVWGRKRPHTQGSCGARPAAILVLVLGLPAPALADPIYAPSAPAPAAAAAAWTRVHIVTQAPKVVLERRVGSLPSDPPPAPRGLYSDGEPVWQTACAVPCDAPIQLGGEYRIGGEGVTTSSPFALHGPTTELRVDAGAYAVRRAGTYLAVIGFVGAAVGGIFLAVQAVRASADGLGTGGYAAIGGLAAGSAVGLVGVGMVGGSGTSVRDETRRDLARITPASGLNATFRF